jgi:hypothetical protein
LDLQRLDLIFSCAKFPSIESKLAAFASLQGHPRLGMHDAGLSYVEDFPAGFKETLPSETILC